MAASAWQRTPAWLRTTLSQEISTDHFLTRYVLSDPAGDDDRAIHGLRSPLLAQLYVYYLELAYERLVAAAPDGQGWPAPVPNSGRMEVFIHRVLGDVYGFTDWDGGAEAPYIALRNGFPEPSADREQCIAAATAVHEVWHAFALTKRGWCKVGPADTDKWRWLHEDSAVYMEHCLLPGGDDHLRYTARWCESPWHSLDSPEAGWAGLFTRFLIRTCGADILRCLYEWQPAADASAEDAALAAVAQVACPAGQPALPDLFAGYCRSAYFLSDPKSPLFSPGAVARFGGRLVSGSYGVRDLPVTVERPLRHLACRYFRFHPNPHSRALTVRVSASCSGSQPPCVRAELLEVRQDQSQGMEYDAVQQDGDLLLEIPDGFTRGRMDHAVLVVSNCSWGADAQDDVEITIEAGCPP